jgi:dienelactone hydrolase
MSFVRLALGIPCACAGLVACAPATLNAPAAPLGPNEEFVSVASRPNVTMRVLLTKPRATPQGVVIHFPGGEGFVVLPDGTIYGAFRRELAAMGYVAALVDVPSEHPGGLGGAGESIESYRISAEHTRDVRAVLEYLHQRWPVPVHLMGHSMGAISAAHLGANLGDKRVEGIALLGSPGQRGYLNTSISLGSAALDRVSVPVLVVHHRNDGCSGAPFGYAMSYPARFTSSPRTGFIEVTGGRTESPNPCVGANHHSFLGQRRQVMEGVMRWFAGEDIRRIDGTEIN